MMLTGSVRKTWVASWEAAADAAVEVAGSAAASKSSGQGPAAWLEVTCFHLVKNIFCWT